MKPSPWIEGVTDAIGFVTGALVGYGIGLVLGFDVFSPGYETSSIIGIVLVGIGGGIGLQIARATRRRSAGAEKGQGR
jgi:F0F1-type ATP synthase assembly protein I